jgi:membrane protease subunit (stomatin/prohibitin family)
MGFFGKQFVDVIEWVESEKGVLAVKFPFEDNEIQNGAQLTVRDSQSAIFVDEGQIADHFGSGRYKLITQTLPILTNLKNWDKAFNSPFKSDVYFFSMREQIGLRWGTQNPITIMDNQIGAIRLRAFGTYAFKVSDPVVFHIKLSGVTEKYSVVDCENQLVSLMMTSMASTLASSQVPFLQMASNQLNFSNLLKSSLNTQFKEYGLELTQFFIENLSLPEDVQSYLDKSTSMALVGDLKEFTQFQTADAILKAAENGDSGVGALGAQMGAGVAIGQALAQSLNGGASAPPQEDVFATIEKLHKLFEKGVISKVEFETKKSELLKKI